MKHNTVGFESKFNSNSKKIKNPVMESRLINPTIVNRSERKMQTTTLAT